MVLIIFQTKIIWSGKSYNSSHGKFLAVSKITMDGLRADVLTQVIIYFCYAKSLGGVVTNMASYLNVKGFEVLIIVCLTFRCHYVRT